MSRLFSLSEWKLVPIPKKMSKREMGDLIELITAFGIERGVVFGDEPQRMAA